MPVVLAPTCHVSLHRTQRFEQQDLFRRFLQLSRQLGWAARPQWMLSNGLSTSHCSGAHADLVFGEWQQLAQRLRTVIYFRRDNIQHLDSGQLSIPV